MIDLKQIDSIQVHFILGPARSGSTLLVYLLDYHENSIAIPEIKHLLHFEKKYSKMEIYSEKIKADYNSFLIKIRRQKPFFFLETSTSSLLDELEIGQKLNFSQLSKIFYLTLSGIKNYHNIKVIVDKNPNYTFHSDRLLKIFPDAKMIVLTRDFHAFVLSNRQSQHPKESTQSIDYYSFVWKIYAQEVLTIKNKIPSQTLIIPYEKLVDKKEEKIEEICQFLGLTYNSAILNFHVELSRKLELLSSNVQLFDRAKKKLKDLSSPINPSRVNAWKQNLKSTEIQFIEAICFPESKHLGYENQFELIEKKYLFSFSKWRVNLFKLLTKFGHVG